MSVCFGQMESVIGFHWIQLREYGGTARMDRPYTFFKKWSCDWCGYDPRTDPWFDSVTWDNEEHKLRTMRGTLVCDHIVRRSDGGSDEKENVGTKCQNCNSKKTIHEKDYHRGNPSPANIEHSQNNN